MGGAAPGEGAAQLVLFTILLLSFTTFTTVHSRDLSDREILRALSILLREGRASGSGQEVRQEDRQAGQEGRRGRQEADGFQEVLGRCEKTGEEVRMRDECSEVNEIQCKQVNVTKFRIDLVERCQTLVDRNCNVTYTELPTPKCVQRQRTKCVTEYKQIEDKVYRDECKVDVQHFCEERIAVAVPEHPYIPPDYQHHPPEYDNPPHPPQLHPEQTKIHQRMLDLHQKEPAQQRYIGPRPRFQNAHNSDSLSFPGEVLLSAKIPYSASWEIHRNKRSSDFSHLREQKEKIVKSLVRQVLSSVLEKNQELELVKGSIKQPRSVGQQFELAVTPGPPGPVPPPALAATTSTHELPAPPGCRSIATKKCIKLPTAVPRKVSSLDQLIYSINTYLQVPYEVCSLVPDVDCVSVLKRVPELQCTPEVYKDCNDIEKKIPYLEEEEECEQVTFDECRTITEKIPIEVCKRQRANEESVTLSRGKIERREGEKRRSPAFRRQIGKSRKSSQIKDSSSVATPTEQERSLIGRGLF